MYPRDDRIPHRPHPAAATADPQDVVGDGTVLACGASPADLLAQVADSAAPTTTDIPAAPSDAPERRNSSEQREVPAAILRHQQSCPHCRAMLAELRELWTPVAAIAQQSITAPPSLARGIMERVTALAQHSWHAVVEDKPGATRIAAWVVAVVARRAAASVPGVSSVANRVHPAEAAVTGVQATFHPPTGSSVHRALADGVGVAGRKVIVQVQLTAGATSPALTVLGHQVRRAVTDHVCALTGLDVVEVDVHIADLETDQDATDHD